MSEGSTIDRYTTPCTYTEGNTAAFSVNAIAGTQRVPFCEPVSASSVAARTLDSFLIVVRTRSCLLWMGSSSPGGDRDNAKTCAMKGRGWSRFYFLVWHMRL